MEQRWCGDTESVLGMQLGAGGSGMEPCWRADIESILEMRLRGSGMKQR